MVPSSRLLSWTALVALPMFLLAGIDSAWSTLWMAGIGCFVLVMVVDLAGSLGRLDDMEVERGKVQRLIQGQDGSLELFIRNPSKAQRHLRLGLPLPKSLKSPYPDLLVMLPSGSERSRLVWPVHPDERGRLSLDQCHLETPSRLGFWDIRKNVPLAMEIRVYPDLSAERKRLSALFLNRGGFGVHAQRQVGKGRDFDKLREYVHGDSYADIDWKATARRSHPITKVFQIERTQEVYVVVDASRLSGRPAGMGNETDAFQGTTMLERFLTAALVLRVAAEKQGDLFGLLTFSDKVQGFLPAKNGRAHYNACRDMLYTLKPRQVTPDFDELITTIRLKMRRRALVFFLTSLDDPLLAENFTRAVSLISRQHLVMVNMIRPRGAQPLFEEEENKGGEIDLYSRLGGHLFWHRLKELEKTLKTRGVSFALLRNENFSSELVTQYINLKQRQLI